MGHRRQVGDDRRAVHVLAERQRQTSLGLRELGGDEDLAQVDGRRLGVRHLHRDGAAPRDRPHDPDRGRLQGERQVVGQVHHLAHLDARGRLELVRGDDRARAHLDDTPFNLEVLELSPDRLGVLLQLLARPLELGGGRDLEEAHRRKLEGFGAAPAEVERLLPREPLLRQAAARARRLDDDRGRDDLGLARRCRARRVQLRLEPSPRGPALAAREFRESRGRDARQRGVGHARHAQHADRDRREQREPRADVAESR